MGHRREDTTWHPRSRPAVGWRPRHFREAGLVGPSGAACGVRRAACGVISSAIRMMSARSPGWWVKLRESPRLRATQGSRHPLPGARIPEATRRKAPGIRCRAHGAARSATRTRSARRPRDELTWRESRRRRGISTRRARPRGRPAHRRAAEAIDRSRRNPAQAQGTGVFATWIRGVAGRRRSSRGGRSRIRRVRRAAVVTRPSAARPRGARCSDPPGSCTRRRRPGARRPG